MRIEFEKKREKNIMTFLQLKKGDCFKVVGYDTAYYVKIMQWVTYEEGKEEKANAICLNYWGAEQIKEHTTVEKVEGHVTIQEDI